MGSTSQGAGVRNGRCHLDSGLEEPLAEPVDAPLSIRDNDDPDAFCEEVGQAPYDTPGVGVDSAGHCVPTGGRDRLHPGALGNCIQSPHGCIRVCQQPVPSGVETREVGHIGAPGDGQGVGQGLLFDPQVCDSVPQAPGFDCDDEGVVIKQVKEDPLVSGKPREP